MEECGSTRALGWCIDLKCYAHEGDVYFQVKDVVEYLQIQKHLGKNGFTLIDKFLSENGKC